MHAEKNTNQPFQQTPTQQTRQTIETVISLLVVLGIFVWCMSILSPFISIILWAAIIAVALNTPFNSLTAAVGGRKKLAALLLTVIGLLLVIVPMWFITSSTLETSLLLKDKVETGSLAVPHPHESVQQWPLVGDRLYTQWKSASENLNGFLQQHIAQVKVIAASLLNKAAGLGLSALQFFIATLIAVGFLLNAGMLSNAVHRLFEKLAGSNGDALSRLAVATIRSVAVGVVGIAVIQATLAGAGMLVIGVPGAGIWAMVILVLAIAQLPPLLVLAPVIVYVFSVDSSLAAILFAIWSIAVSFADMVLKPLLLGRGVDAPMLVILLGAIGGMITSGIIGLFVGAVVLAFGYMLLGIWLRDGNANAPEPASQS